MLTAPSVRLALGLPLVAAGLLLAPNAAAEDAAVTVHELDPKTGAALKQTDLRLDYLNLGPILSLIGGYQHATGFGLEGSWITYPTGKLPSFGYGAFLQAQLYDWKYARTAAGAELTAGPAGVELGLAFRQGDGTYASTVATHTAVFLSIGYLLLAVRASAQLFALPSNEPSFGLETALTLGLKLPITVYGQDPSGAVIQASGHAW